MINMLEQLPAGILDVDATRLHEFVENHTLVHIDGSDKRPLFISILQHGDETTGWDAIKALLTEQRGQLARSIYLLFGNVQAARQNLRQLNGQPDFNRCWPGLHNNTSDIAKKMAFITEMMAEIKPFASIDIHNNSGRNPHYAGINSMQAECVNLAALFSDTIIHFTSPDGIQSGAFTPFCPSVTIECGMSGTASGTEHTHQFLDQLIHLKTLKIDPVVTEKTAVLNVFSTVKVRPETAIAIEGNNEEADQAIEFLIKDDLDHLNFKLAEKGAVFGYTVDENAPMPFIVTDQIGNDITALYFERKGQEIQTKQSVVPAMITQSVAAIRHDCLCYFMHPLEQNP